MAEKIKIIPLGGLNEIGKNLTVYEYGGDIIVVDCGMAFPGDDMYGVDMVIPDVTYLVKNANRIRGLFITHGHEDHIGAIPYVLRQVNMPIFCTRLTAGLIKLKLEEHGLTRQTKITTMEAGQSVKAGKFEVEFIHVNHSIADSAAFAIRTKMGTIIHTGDFKIDSTPIDGKIIDLGRFGELGKQGVLALLCDSTNVERPGYTQSERSIGRTFDQLFAGCDKRIIVTTFASNIHRVQQAIDAAVKYGRKVAVTGRSMENIVKVCTELGYTNIPKNTLIDVAKAKKLPNDKVVIITTGSQGEEMSALYRMAFSTHKQVEVGYGDRIIISASAIPGNENSVSAVVNELFRKGCDVIYGSAWHLHVSGHACQEELKIIHALTAPKFFIPLHGEQRMLQLHSELAQSLGLNPKNVAIAENGSVIELTHRSIRVERQRARRPGAGGRLRRGRCGRRGAAGSQAPAEDGMVVVNINLAAQGGGLLAPPDIITRGFIYVKESGDLMQELQDVVTDTVNKYRQNTKRGRRGGNNSNNSANDGSLSSAVKSAVSSYLYKATRRNPMILPIVNELKTKHGRLPGARNTGAAAVIFCGKQSLFFFHFPEKPGRIQVSLAHCPAALHLSLPAQGFFLQALGIELGIAVALHGVSPVDGNTHPIAIGPQGVFLLRLGGMIEFFIAVEHLDLGAHHIRQHLARRGQAALLLGIKIQRLRQHHHMFGVGQVAEVKGGVLAPVQLIRAGDLLQAHNIRAE